MIRIVAIALTLGVIGAQGTLAQTAPNATTSPSPASPSVAPPSVATAPPPAPATAPPRPITGPAAMAPANSTATRSTSTPPAVSTSNADSKTTAAPVAGANSFTEAEARSRLEAHGYTNVSGLQKDAQSIWRGTAMKNGQSVGVALDYQGNIVAQ